MTDDDAITRGWALGISTSISSLVGSSRQVHIIVNNDVGIFNLSAWPDYITEALVTNITIIDK